MVSTHEYESMGTHWKITIWDEIAENRCNEIFTTIEEKSKRFDELYSRFKKTSLVWKITESKGVIEVPKEFTEMLSWYMKFYEISNKKLNPCIGYAISDLGYDDTYSLSPKEIIRRVPDFFEAVIIIDDTHIELKEKVLFDFGALGKGYFVDLIASFLKSENIKHFLVNGSGDIFYEGNGNPIKAGLEHPNDPTKVIGTISMEKGSMCASGINRRAWSEYNHYIDPETLSSPKEIIATWVIADTAVVADGLASILFFVAPETITDMQFEYCILNKDYQVKRSEGFEVELF